MTMAVEKAAIRSSVSSTFNFKSVTAAHHHLSNLGGFHESLGFKFHISFFVIGFVRGR